jgi:hypothetical protein
MICKYFKENKIEIFIPEFDISHQVILYSYKLNDILEYIIDDNKFMVLNKQEGTNYKLQLLQKIDLSLTIIPEADRLIEKLKISVINPCPLDIL